MKNFKNFYENVNPFADPIDGGEYEDDMPDGAKWTMIYMEFLKFIKKPNPTSHEYDLWLRDNYNSPTSLT